MMKAWEMMYDQDVLAEAMKLSEDVKIVENDGIQIIAEIESFKVTTYIQYNSPTYASCNCPKKYQCKHEAALIYYLINHPEIYVRELNLNEMVRLADENLLKKFLLTELESDKELKKRFLNEFKSSPIDKKHYDDKLSKVFRLGKGRDFKLHGIYDMDVMENSLEDFLIHDISDILSSGEYDLACRLLSRIADVLNDEVASTYDSWDNLVDEFFEQVDVLSSSIHLDADRMNDLYSRMDVINDLL